MPFLSGSVHGVGTKLKGRPTGWQPTKLYSQEVSVTISFARYKVSFSLRKLILLGSLAAVAISAGAQDNSVKKIDFDLHVNPKFQSCLGSGGSTPTAHVTVKRGALADTLIIEGHNFLPKLAFDMFTVQRSNLLSDGSPDPNFTTFGLAWYQSDLHADSGGNFKASIKTILLDQIFGFDPDASLTPINTFHVGFWFNDPNDANTNGCKFDVSHPTPFNGEHSAGPVAMMSVPDANTGLGPLCTNPNGNGTCNP